MLVICGDAHVVDGRDVSDDVHEVDCRVIIDLCGICGGHDVLTKGGHEDPSTEFGSLVGVVPGCTVRGLDRGQGRGVDYGVTTPCAC